ncbi:RNA polymerase II degradation factor 1 [Scaptodrosophila lebanonensis]|uniref:RNA polymerase II degradation factor 1 n=1 Tax=Drosophila lebanonensis TaxID=7225 RepID=A0A6J2T377_DROLE|nr:RNA polymerase II degradation factor 1 [Scaptodrosophila lebanonensis]
MKPIAILVVLSCALLAASVPQGYKYQQPQVVQQGQQVKQTVPLGNLRPQTPVSSSGIYSVPQAPSLGQFSVQTQQQQQQQQQIQTIQNIASPPASIGLPAPIPVQAPIALPQLQVPQPQQQPQLVSYQQPQQFVQNVQQPQQQFVQTQYVQRPAIVTKDIYIHSAPDDTEEIGQAGPGLDSGPIRKNYRIVFIKAPSQNLRYTAAALKRAQATNEEKTVIYVLSKKPDISEIQQQLQVTQSEAKVHKPEVYFIKYKTQEEAQRAQQEIQAQYDALGGATHISDEGIAPITSVSGGPLNLGSLVPQQIQSQQIVQPHIQTISQSISQPQIVQTHTTQELSHGSQQQTFVQQGGFQASSLGTGINFGASLPSRKYVPAKALK